MRRRLSRSLSWFVVGALALLFGTPLRLLWLSSSLPFLAVFGIWGGAVLALALAAHYERASAAPQQTPRERQR